MSVLNGFFLYLKCESMSVFQLASKILEALRISVERHMQHQATLKEADSTSKDPAQEPTSQEVAPQPSTSQQSMQVYSTSTGQDASASTETEPVQEQGYDPATGMVS